jgi:hypothetical protein
MVHQPTGYISLNGGPLQEWPKRGDVIDLPDVMAEGMIASGNAKRVTKDADDEKVETRPAPTAGVETRPDAPVKRGPGRPRKNPEQGKG